MRLAPIFLLILAGILFGFQFLHLTTMALWHDEAFSGLLIQYGLPEMMHRIALDVHPPLYYLVLKIWAMVFTSSLFALRLFSFTFGALTIFATYALAKKITEKKSIALLSSALLALSSFQIQYNLEARMYTLGTFFIVCSSIFLLQGLRRNEKKYWFLYALFTSAALYTHYYTFFIACAQGLFLLYSIFKNATIIRSVFFSFALVFISYIPWLPTFLKQLKQVEQSFWIPPMTIWSIPSTLLKMLTGVALPPERFAPLLVFGTLLIFASSIFAVKKLSNNPKKWLLPLALYIPFIGSIVLSLKTSIYLDRYFIFSLPFFFILIASALLYTPNVFTKRLLIVTLVMGTFVSFPIFWHVLKPEQKPGMAGAASYLNQRANPHDKIFVGSSFVYFTFKYYNNTSIAPLLYAPTKLQHYSGTALLSDNDIIKDFSRGVKNNDKVWTIDTTGFGNFQPQAPSSWIKKSEAIFPDVYDYRGSIIVREYDI